MRASSLEKEESAIATDTKHGRCHHDTLPDAAPHRDASSIDVSPLEASPDSPLDSPGHDVAADIVALDSSPPPSGPPCTPDGGGCDDGGVCQAGVCKMCRPGCTTDDDGANQCPAVPGALNCCDTSSGVCFTSAEFACPDQPQAPPCSTSADCAAGSCCDPSVLTCEPSETPCPPPTCASECHSDSDCNAWCPTPPAGFVNWCDWDVGECAVVSRCFPLFSLDAGADCGFDGG